MKSLFYSAILFLGTFLATLPSYAQNSQLSGTMTGPDGTPFNGYLKLALEQQGAAIAPACTAYGAPAQVLPGITVTVKVSNGSLVSPPKVWGADCLQPGNIPYNITVQDIYGNTLYKDAWIIQGTTFDVGTAVSVYNPNITYGVTGITGPVKLATGPVSFTGAVSQVGNTFNFNGGTASNPASPAYAVQFANSLVNAFQSDSTILINPTTHNFIAPLVNFTYYANAYSSLSAALTASAGGSLVISQTQNVTTNTTIPTNVAVEVRNGGSFNVSSGATLSWNGPITAGRTQIFNSSASVSFNGNSFIKEVFPEWWGADPTDTNPSAVPMQAAFNAGQKVHGTGGTVSCPQATYYIENTLTSFAFDSNHGLSIIGPDSQNSGFPGVCAFDYHGPPGTTVIHYLGGHQGLIKNINISGGNRGIWLDTAQGVPASTTSTAMARSSNVVSVTLAAAETAWVSGVNLVVSGCADTSYDGYFPIWYQTDSTHIAWVQGGTNGSTTGCTVATPVGADDAGIKLQHVQVFGFKSQTASISTASISSNVLSVTMSSAIVQHPDQWIYIFGAGDPVYNGYWHLLTVTNGGLSFTATATEVISEASISSGTVQGPSAGISFGANSLANVNASVCCTNFNDVQVNGGGISPVPIMGFEWDATSNTKDFQFSVANSSSTRIGFGSFGTGGSFDCYNCEGYGSIDAVFASSVLGSVHIHDLEREQEEGAYFFASLPSGSYNAALYGTSGQFELNNSNGTILITNVHDETTNYAPDGVAISTGGNLTMIGNTFGFPGQTASFVTSVVLATPGSGQTPGTYQVSASGGGGTGAQIGVVVGAGGTVTTTILNNQGSGYTSAPTFTLSAGGTPATFTATLGYSAPLIDMSTYKGSTSPLASLTSLGNIYYNITAGNFVPVVDRLNGNYPAYGTGSRGGGIPVTSLGDWGSDPGVGGGTLTRLSNAVTLAELRYAAPTTGGPVNVATVGFPKYPNNVNGPCWLNAAGSDNDCLSFNASDQMQVTNPICAPCTSPIGRYLR